MTGDALELKMYDNLIKQERLNYSHKKKKQWALNCEQQFKEELELIKKTLICQYCNKKYNKCYCFNNL